jgi:hypothetical protein
MERNDTASETIIYEPDYSLKHKLGGYQSLEDILVPRLIEEAERTVTKMELLEQLLEDMRHLKAETSKLKSSSIPVIIEMAFSIKSKAGLCGYSLASALGKSLHVFCETLEPDAVLGTKEQEIIRCLVQALKTVFDQKVTGNGGAVGEAITAELKRLAVRFG